MGMEDEARAESMAVLQLLQQFRGRSYVLTREDIAGRLGIRDRIVRAAIAELRRQGHLIVADESGGYRFANGWDDVLRYTSSLKSRLTSLREVVERMETQAAIEFGSVAAHQERLF